MLTSRYAYSRFDPECWWLGPYQCGAEGDGGAAGGAGGGTATPAPQGTPGPQGAPGPQGRAGADGVLRIQIEGPSNGSQATPPAPPASGDAGGNNAGGRSGEPSRADLRAEAAAYRIEARTAKEQLEQVKAENERIKAEADQRVAAEAAKHEPKVSALQQRLVTAELKSAAVAAGIVDLDVLPLMESVTGMKVAIDFEGNVTGAAEAMAKFKELKPTFFKAAADGSAGDAGNPGANNGNNAGTGANNGGGAQPAARPSGSGAVPPAQQPQAKRATEMTTEEYAAWKKERMRGLRQVA